MKFVDPLLTRHFNGLRPIIWICVGNGFVREDVKAFLLQSGQGFVGDAVTNLQGLCTRVVEAGLRETTAIEASHTKTTVLGPASRQEVLRMLLAEPRISGQLPELKRLRRQNTFFRKLDRTLQSARLSFAHADEESVYSERLQQRVGPSLIRDEVRALSQAFEAWLKGMHLWDLPLLIQSATEILREARPKTLHLPKEILHYTAQTLESREQEFWAALEQYVRVTRVGLLGESVINNEALSCEKWHTLDDAAESLAERLVNDRDASHTILIPDFSAVRRSLMQSLESRGLPLADPRDPTRLRWDEGLKWAMLPLKVVARGFERDSVISWLRTHAMQKEFSDWVREIHARGIRERLTSYSGGMLSGVHSRLSELEQRFGGRRTCNELGDAHTAYLRTALGGREDALHWVLPFFEQVWKEFCQDMSYVGQAPLRAPSLYWLERFETRLLETPAPVERMKADKGIRIYRLNQAPLESVEKLWIFGMQANWLSGEGVGDYWFSEREREVLSSEFSVRSAIQVYQERLCILKSWLVRAKKVTFLDAHYDWDGRERDTLLPVFSELLSGGLPEMQEMGSHPRWIKSYSALRPVPPQSIKLSPLAAWGISEIKATELDDYSRCGFLAMGGKRWRLEDTKEADVDLWPESQGILLHAAAKILLESRDEQGGFKKTSSQALKEAWALKRPKGMLRGKRLEHYAKKRLEEVLEAFCEKEREYVLRSGAKVLSLEGPSLRMEFPEYCIVGVPDRIDEHNDGVFVIDFKTSSVLPKGNEILEQGYRLQLPFYALATQKEFGKQAIGVQFIELNKRASRSKGIFFKPWNGKEPGKLTNVTSRNQSLLDMDPAETWLRIEQALIAHATGFFSGEFEARPKKPEECRNCRFDDLCGKRRVGQSDQDGGTEGGGVE
jgi:hypothetical protein